MKIPFGIIFLGFMLWVHESHAQSGNYPLNLCGKDSVITFSELKNCSLINSTAKDVIIISYSITIPATSGISNGTNASVDLLKEFAGTGNSISPEIMSKIEELKPNKIFVDAKGLLNGQIVKCSVLEILLK